MSLEQVNGFAGRKAIVRESKLDAETINVDIVTACGNTTSISLTIKGAKLLSDWLECKVQAVQAKKMQSEMAVANG